VAGRALRDLTTPLVASWNDVRLVKEALSGLDLDAVDTSTTLLGRKVALPLVIAGMTR
jgi:isopentenyl diphosphate isomerase/L-lactate dehydrogenase-like FMN-dependent dehydrogenase